MLSSCALCPTQDEPLTARGRASDHGGSPVREAPARRLPETVRTGKVARRYDGSRDLWSATRRNSRHRRYGLTRSTPVRSGTRIGARAGGRYALVSTGWTPEGIVVLAYDPRWPEMFSTNGCRLLDEPGDVAVRVDHIGSTAVVGLDAKPIIDIQVSVASFEPIDEFRVPLECAGFVYRPDNTDRTKLYFRERPGDRRTHIHVRRVGSFSEQFALLFRGPGGEPAGHQTRVPATSGYDH